MWPICSTISYLLIIIYMSIFWFFDSDNDEAITALGIGTLILLVICVLTAIFDLRTYGNPFMSLSLWFILALINIYGIVVHLVHFPNMSNSWNFPIVLVHGFFGIISFCSVIAVCRGGCDCSDGPVYVTIV